MDAFCEILTTQYTAEQALEGNDTFTFLSVQQPVFLTFCGVKFKGNHTHTHSFKRHPCRIIRFLSEKCIRFSVGEMEE